MTREEAIEQLQNCIDLIKQDGQDYLDERDFPLLDMAIEALKTEPIRCGECENYIDRRCIEANHHVAAHGNCMGVFGAKRREL